MNKVKKMIGKLKLRFGTKSIHTRIPQEEIEQFKSIADNCKVVFDVGCRDDLFFLNVKKDCEYHLFEPNLDFVASLRKKLSKLKGFNVKINEYGLSDVHADNCVYFEKSQSFIINPFLKEGDIDTGKKFSTRRLDSYVKENNIGTIDFLKIDAEGMDYRIIQGGLEIIKNRVQYIQFEYWNCPRKFYNLLSDTFELYLMIEPRLKQFLEETDPRRNWNYKMIKLDEELCSFLEIKAVPVGVGGNIFGKKK